MVQKASRTKDKLLFWQGNRSSLLVLSGVFLLWQKLIWQKTSLIYLCLIPELEITFLRICKQQTFFPLPLATLYSIWHYFLQYQLLWKQKKDNSVQCQLRNFKSTICSQLHIGIWSFGLKYHSCALRICTKCAELRAAVRLKAGVILHQF